MKTLIALLALSRLLSGCSSPEARVVNISGDERDYYTVAVTLGATGFSTKKIVCEDNKPPCKIDFYCDLPICYFNFSSDKNFGEATFRFRLNNTNLQHQRIDGGLVGLNGPQTIKVTSAPIADSLEIAVLYEYGKEGDYYAVAVTLGTNGFSTDEIICEDNRPQCKVDFFCDLPRCDLTATNDRQFTDGRFEWHLNETNYLHERMPLGGYGFEGPQRITVISAPVTDSLVISVLYDYSTPLPPPTCCGPPGAGTPP